MMKIFAVLSTILLASVSFGSEIEGQWVFNKAVCQKGGEISPTYYEILKRTTFEFNATIMAQKIQILDNCVLSQSGSYKLSQNVLQVSAMTGSVGAGCPPGTKIGDRPAMSFQIDLRGNDLAMTVPAGAICPVAGDSLILSTIRKSSLRRWR